MVLGTPKNTGKFIDTNHSINRLNDSEIIIFGDVVAKAPGATEI